MEQKLRNSIVENDCIALTCFINAITFAIEPKIMR